GVVYDQGRYRSDYEQLRCTQIRWQKVLQQGESYGGTKGRRGRGRSQQKEEGGVAARGAFKSVAVSAKAGASWRDFPHSLSLHAKAKAFASLAVQVPRGSPVVTARIIVALNIQLFSGVARCSN
ncbi:hypothetical protein COCCADRAFT_95352, partial [Bipolaris zeicola 26-R-13]